MTVTHEHLLRNAVSPPSRFSRALVPTILSLSLARWIIDYTRAPLTLDVNYDNLNVFTAVCTRTNEAPEVTEFSNEEFERCLPR